jgi:hypothetical protein
MSYASLIEKARREAILEAMECAKQIVRSYGSQEFSEADREGICGFMDHFARTAK